MMIMEEYYYYRFPKSAAEIPVHFGDSDIEVKKVLPKMFVEGMTSMNLGKRGFLYHFVCTFLKRGFNRTFVEYDLCKNNKVVSKAVLISKDAVYQFLPPKGIHLGFCETVKDERGKGYYPALLQYICRINPTKDFHMIVKVGNTSSIRGIEKAGFKRYGGGIKNHKGHFIITKIYNDEK